MKRARPSTSSGLSPWHWPVRIAAARSRRRRSSPRAPASWRCRPSSSGSARSPLICRPSSAFWSWSATWRGVRLQRAEARAKLLLQAAASRQRADADRALAQAARSDSRPGPVRDLAVENAKLKGQLVEPVLEQMLLEVSALRAQAAEIDARSDAIRRAAANRTLRSEFVEALLDRLHSLPTGETFARQREARSKLAAATFEANLRTARMLAQLSDLDAATTVALHAAGVQEADAEALRPAIRQQLSAKRELLDQAGRAGKGASAHAARGRGGRGGGAHPLRAGARRGDPAAGVDSSRPARCQHPRQPATRLGVGFVARQLAQHRQPAAGRDSGQALSGCRLGAARGPSSMPCAGGWCGGSRSSPRPPSRSSTIGSATR